MNHQQLGHLSSDVTRNFLAGYTYNVGENWQPGMYYHSIQKRNFTDMYQNIKVIIMIR